jgi:hypothetical protein
MMRLRLKFRKVKLLDNGGGPEGDLLFPRTIPVLKLAKKKNKS